MHTNSYTGPRLIGIMSSAMLNITVPVLSAIYQTIQGLAILRCLYGSEMVLLGVVIGKCEMPSTDISQENEHAILIVKCQFVAYNFR